MHDYATILPVLQRMLRCGEPGSGIIYGWEQPCSNGTTYLGEAVIHLYANPAITDLTNDADWQEHLRHAAVFAGAHRQPEYWYPDRIDLDCDVDVAVTVPVSVLSPDDLALHQLRTLLVNNYDWGDGAGHEWALDVGESLANDYADRQEVVFGDEWDVSDWEDRDWQPLASFLAALKIRPTAVGNTRRWDDRVELPETPALEWVKEQGAIDRLFPSAADTWGEIATAIAFCLDGLAEGRPDCPSPTLLYLNDAFALERDAALSTIVARVSEVPAAAPFAGRIQAASSPDAVNAALRELYEAAPGLGVWVVA